MLIRPSNVLIIFPLLVTLAGAWRQLALWALAGVPAAAWLLWYNHVLYGNALVTGYGGSVASHAHSDGMPPFDALPRSSANRSACPTRCCGSSPSTTNWPTAAATPNA